MIVTQLGVDAHWRDPLTHLALTTQGFEALFRRIHQLARHQKTTPRYLAVGGGGYDHSVVPRAWTLAWGVMSEQTFPNELPVAVATDYNPPLLHDEALPLLTSEQRRQARTAAEEVVRELQEKLKL